MCGQFHPGKNVGIGRDFTIYSMIDGLVKFEKFGPDRKKVRVVEIFNHLLQVDKSGIRFSLTERNGV